MMANIRDVHRGGWAPVLKYYFSLAAVVGRTRWRGAAHPFVPSAHLPGRMVVAHSSLQRVSNPAVCRVDSRKERSSAGRRVMICSQTVTSRTQIATVSSANISRQQDAVLSGLSQHDLHILSGGLNVEDQRCGCRWRDRQSQRTASATGREPSKPGSFDAFLTASWHQRHTSSQIPAAMMILREKKQGLPCTLKDRWWRSPAKGSGTRERRVPCTSLLGKM